MALIPLAYKLDWYDPLQPGGNISTLNNNANTATSYDTQYTMQDVVDTAVGYKSYTSLVTQAGVTAPTDVILKNDTGVTMTWGYTSPGVYTLTSSSPIFTNNKTIVFLNMGRPAIPNLVWMWTRTSDTVITIENSAISDAKIVNGAFEIRIYS